MSEKKDHSGAILAIILILAAMFLFIVLRGVIGFLAAGDWQIIVVILGIALIGVIIMLADGK